MYAATLFLLGGGSMVDVIEAKGWTYLKAAFTVDVQSLEDLEKIAEGLGIPFIIRKGKEHLVFSGQIAAAPLCYRYKK